MPRPRTWSDDDNTQLMQLVADNVPREEISRRLRKTRRQISTQICKLRIRRDLRALRAEAAAADQQTNHGAFWSPEEIERVMSLGSTACLADWPTIAREHFPGRTAKACKEQYYVRRRTARCAAHNAPSQVKQKVEPRRHITAPPRLSAAAPQSLTAAIMGDPLPGRSALDQRQQRKESTSAGTLV